MISVGKVLKWLWTERNENTLEGMRQATRFEKIGWMIMLIVSVVLLVKCDWDEMRKPSLGYTKYCVDGVEYLRFQNGGASVAMTSDGSVKACN